MEETSGDSEKQIRRNLSSSNCTETITMTKLHLCESEDAMQAVLSDFELLDFAKNPCDDPSEMINYNEGKEADPFNKISKHYGREKNVFLFISMLQDEEQLKKITDIIDQKCDAAAKEKFMKRINIYLKRVKKGGHDVQECLMSSEFPDAFFHGYYHGPRRNVHKNLNINFTKCGQILDVSRAFNNRVKRMKEEKSGVERIKIYSNGKRVGAILKSEQQQQRKYSFSECSSCDLSVNWAAEDEQGGSINCTVVLGINSGKIDDFQFKINGKDVEPRKILDLAKQNDDVLVKGKSLYEVLQKNFRNVDVV